MDFVGDLIGPMTEGIALLTRLDLWLIVIAGVAWGLFAGAMPGIGSVLAFGLVLPFTFGMEPMQAVAFLLAISVAVGFGNSIPAILLSVPGTPAAVLTAIDGFKLHKRGESGLALGVSFVAALVGQVVSIPFFVLLVVPLSGLAYVFLAPEIFALYLLGMVAILSLTGKNMLKGLVAALFGISVAYVGLDPVNASQRFVFVPDLIDGFDTTPVVLGLLAISELLRQARQTFRWSSMIDTFSAAFPWGRLRETARPIAIGTIVGTLEGAVPGGGSTTAAMISYQQAQMLSKHPEEFGNGSIEAIAANESAQNAANSGELIPTLGLGIPGSGSMVLLLAALQVQGLVPGPLLTQQSPELLHGAVAGMLAAAIILAITGWFISKWLLRVLTIDRSLIIVVALALVVVGVFSLNYQIFDVVTALLFGVIGYFMLRYGYSVAAAALAVILARGFERALRQGLGIFNDSIIEFLSRPVTAVIVVISIFFLIVGVRRTLRLERDAAAARGAAAERAAAVDDAGAAS